MKFFLGKATSISAPIEHVAVILLATVSMFLFLDAQSASAAELILSPAESPAACETVIKRPDQLPLSRVAAGSRNILTAWLAAPTDKYQHAVLGDALEATRMVVETRVGNRLQVDLPENRVFEDLETRLVDLNGDNQDEILVVESDINLGASLAVFSIVDQQLVRTAATPFIGIPHRWLNPLGVGDFDGDGHLEVALVAIPHIGGLLRLYRQMGDKLVLFAELGGVSTHKLGSTELGFGQVVSAEPRDRILLPDESHQVLMLLEWADTEWREISRVDLPAALKTSLRPVGEDRWQFQLHNGNDYEIRVDQ